MYSKEMINKIYELKPFEQIDLKIDDYLASQQIMRVPGGWVLNATIFIPFNKEFYSKETDFAKYPIIIYQQVLLVNGKIVDWKIGLNKKEGPFHWLNLSYNHIKEFVELTQKTNEILVNNNEEYNKAFENEEWFKQFELHEEFKAIKPF